MNVFTPSRIKKTMPDLAEFMTTQEAAKKLGFTVVSVRRLPMKFLHKKQENQG